MKLDDSYKLYGFELVNHKRIIRLMRLYKIKCSIRTKNPYHKIWKATKEDKSVPNLLSRKFKNAYIHSSKGVHYTSSIFRTRLSKSNLGQSMSRR